jgi:hypothetical protein
MKMPLKRTTQEGNRIPWDGIMERGAQEISFPSIVPQTCHPFLQNKTVNEIFVISHLDSYNLLFPKMGSNYNNVYTQKKLKIQCTNQGFK